MRRFLLISFAILLSTLSAVSFVSSSASAASVYDGIIETTDKLDWSYSERSFDLTTRWYSEILEALRIRCEVQGASGYCAAYYAMRDNMLDGYWWVDIDRSPDNNPYPLTLYFTETQNDTNCSFSTVSSNHIFSCVSATNSVWRVRNIGHQGVSSVETEYGIGVWRQPDQINSFPRDNSISTRYIFLSTFPVTYPTGYAGQEIPQTINVGPSLQNPIFSWNLTADSDFYLVYLPLIADEYLPWGWSVDFYDSLNDGSYSPGSVIHSDRFDPTPESQIHYKFNNYGEYIVKIKAISSQIPRPNWKNPGNITTEYILKINVNGMSSQGDNLMCIDGICEAPVVNCSIQPDFMQRFQCEISTKFNFGLINPSINAIKSIFLAFIVPSSPSCGFALADAQVAGFIFPLSGLPAQVCDRASTMHSTFPIAGIVLNFVFAIALLGLVGALVNRITDEKDHRIVEGV